MEDGRVRAGIASLQSRLSLQVVAVYILVLDDDIWLVTKDARLDENSLGIDTRLLVEREESGPFHIVETLTTKGNDENVYSSRNKGTVNISLTKST